MRPQSNLISNLTRSGVIEPGDLSETPFHCRDNFGIRVWEHHGLQFYVLDGSSASAIDYENSPHRREEPEHWRTAERRALDTARRIVVFSDFILGKKILDFGAGRGDFARAAKGLARKIHCVELSRDLRTELEVDGLSASAGLPMGEEYDTIFGFHIIEHLDDPIDVLAGFQEILAPRGVVVLEVPNSRDWLIRLSSRFQDHVFWSQHVATYSRKSMSVIVEKAGYEMVSISGVQRYSMANFVGWLGKKPVEHASLASKFLESRPMNFFWELGLRLLDRTDTITIIARKPVASGRWLNRNS